MTASDKSGRSDRRNEPAQGTRVNYQFTRALLVGTILDYSGVLASRDLVALDRSKHLTGDVLMTYLVAPGRQLFAKTSYSFRF